MSNPAPSDPTGPGRKVTYATVATYLLFTALLAIVNGINNNVDVIVSVFPHWLNVFITPVIPAVITLVTGWITQHAPADLKMPVKEKRRKSLH